jgi:UDP-glucose 4-epimerase
MILVTGSSGYIGSHLVALLDSRVVKCDLKEGQDFSRLRGHSFGAVIHLAAHASVTQSLKEPEECLNNNAFKLIPFLINNEVGKLVFASTGGAIYGNRHLAKEEEASWNGCISPYGQSKYLAEQIIRRLHPNHAILRFGNVYGGNDADRLEAAAHSHFKTDDPIVIYGGDQTRDFVLVDVICRALIRAALGSAVGTFNIGSGVETRVGDVAKEYSVKRKVPIVYRSARAGEIDHVSLDITKAKQSGLL